jgi:hypothetical protein
MTHRRRQRHAETNRDRGEGQRETSRGTDNGQIHVEIARDKPRDTATDNDNQRQPHADIRL